MNRIGEMKLEYDSKRPRLVFLDTSVLISPSRHGEKISISKYKRLFSICKNEIIITSTVSNEFHSLEESIPKREKGELIERKKNLQEMISSTRDVLSKFDAPSQMQDCFSLVIEKNVCNYLQSRIDNISTICEKAFEEVRRFHDLKQNINSFTLQEKIRICEEGKVRYESHIPPGYGDDGKTGIEKYHDLIIWKEIIKETNALCEKNNQKGLNVFFVSEDKKEKTESDCRFLKQEFMESTGCKLFKVTMDQFGSWFVDEYKEIDSGIISKIQALSHMQDSKQLSETLNELTELGLSLDTQNKLLADEDRQILYSRLHQEQNVLDVIPLEFWSFSERAKNCIIYSNLSLARIASMDLQEVARTGNFGKYTLKEIQEKLSLVHDLIYPDSNEISWKLLE